MKLSGLLLACVSAVVLSSQFSGYTATFTNNTWIDVEDWSFDGQALVISNCTVTVDGPHTFSDVELGPGGKLTHSFAPNGFLPGRYANSASLVLTRTYFQPLNATGIITSSILVRDLAGTVTYSEGLDYLVSTDTNQVVFLQLTPASAIAEGSTNRVEFQGIASVVPSGLSLNITGDLVVAAGAAIDATEQGYIGGAGPGLGRYGTSGSGAGHGGIGGFGQSLALRGEAYGSISQPTEKGSGGGSGYAGLGGSGGGAIHLSVSGVLRIDGAIRADGGHGLNPRSGGGSGGSVYVRAQMIVGNGLISADGGRGEPDLGGGGAGGRIALTSANDGFTGTLSAKGGRGYQAGGPGSIYRKTDNQTIAKVVFNNAGQPGSSVILESAAGQEFSFEGGAVISVPSPFHAANLVIHSNSLLQLTNVQVLVVSNITVEAGGAISADGTGYGANTGPGAGRRFSSVGPAGSGAGHGGFGAETGSSPRHPGGITYGDPLSPQLPGSGGGNWNSLGSEGGGAVRLIVSGTLLCNGTLSANGADGLVAGAGGGSGGSVWLTAGLLAGGGLISANGGSGYGFGPSAGGGGGGGRIAIKPTVNLFFGRLTAYGGAGYGTGGAGTIFIQDALNSRFIADNGGRLGTNTIWSSAFINVDVTVKGGAVLACSSLNARSLFIGAKSWLLTEARPHQNLNLTILSDATIEPGGGITADGSGYPSGQGPGGGRYYSFANSWVGGGAGHGGFGAALGTNIAIGGNGYGEISTPTQPGSGGGSALNAGGPGGGAIRLTVNGHLNLQGLLSANGLQPTNFNSGGGSGGSIWITTGSISGNGVITANGGAGLELGGGGGGGRIAITYNGSSFGGTITARGGAGAGAGGAGTIFQKANNQYIAQILVDNGGQSGTNTAWTIPVPSSGLSITGGARMALPSGQLSLANLMIASNSWLFATNLSLTISSNVTVHAGGGIIADSNGSPAGTGPGAGRFAFSTSTAAGGGGHGGFGGAAPNTSVPTGGNTYGFASNPVDPGSGGGSPSTSASGGRGGGVIRFDVSGILRVDGTISAHGGEAVSPGGGGGSGGSVWISAGNFFGAGSIGANGGAGQGLGGGGGGGRIAFACRYNSFSGKLSAFGGLGANVGGAGTIVLQEQPQKDSHVIVDNGGRAGTNTSWSTGGSSVDLTLINGAAMSLPSITLRSLFIGSNSRLTSANITVISNAVIEAGGSLHADGLGWAAGSGPGAGRYISGSTAGGAGHGGYGGQGSDPRMSGGNTYGSLSTPVDNGSGGGSVYYYYSGGSGGGAIRLTVSGSLTVNGAISANGGDASAYGSGGGSGGSVWLTCHTLAGSGVIRANGGAGQNAGGGGGGRIALHLTYDTFTGRCTAFGGGGSSIGGAGTIYIQNYRQGYYRQVIVDNGGQHGTNTSWFDSIPIHLTVRGGGIVAPQSLLKLESLLLSTNGWIRTTTQQPITVTKDAFIEAGGGIVADGSGALSPAPGLLNGGGGHGGYGGGNGGNAYGSITAPRDQGGAGSGGNLGGGVVDLTVNGTLILNGRISANGNDVAGAGAGAGGSIRLNPNFFSGSGSISANGGSGLYGGGGGRVAVAYGLNTFTGTISACGGSAPEHSGGAGTVFLQGRNLQTGTLIVDNGGQAGTNTLLTPFPNGSDLIIRGGAIAWPSASSLAVSNLSLQPGGTLTGQRLSTNLDVIVLGKALIAPGASINVAGKGFSAMAGPGAGSSTNSIGSGAGHGGQGGASSLQPGGVAYGSVEQPLERGSGGGLGYSLPHGGSQGGGALRLNVSGSLVINGQISANGNPGFGDDSGGGSGGSILILATTLSGEGRIEAHGGDGQLYTGGGGAGGRIALYSPLNFFSGNCSASGGDGFAEGSTGSVFYSASPLALQVVGQSLSGTVIQPVSAIDLQFNTPLDLASLSPADFSINTPTGTLSEVVFTTPTPASLRLAFPQQIAEGAYNLTFGPDVRNVYGQPMPAAFSAGFSIAWPVISGRVTDSDDRPVSGVHLQAGTLLSTVTDAHGFYSFKAPPEDCFTVQPSAENSLFVPSSRTYCAVSDSQSQDYLLVDSVSPTLTKTFQTNGISLEWQGIPGVTYQVMYSSDLVDWSYWSEGITCTPTNRWVKVFIPRDDSPQRFFRLQGSY